MVDFQVAYDKLMAFETAEDIRQYFQDIGMIGIRRSSFMCPIANWFKEVTGLQHLCVGLKIYIPGCGLEEDGTISDTDFDGFPLSKACSNFIENFDKSEYSELIN